MKDGAVETKMFIRSRAGFDLRRRRSADDSSNVGDDSSLLAAIRAAGGEGLQIGDPVSSTAILGPNGNKIGTCKDDVCSCVGGYEKNGDDELSDECVDVNECLTQTETVCGGPSAGTCFNTDGAFSCNCNDGFRKEGGICVDIDECASEGHSCSADSGQKCHNTIGAYECMCKEGFKQLSEVIKSERVTTCVELKFAEWSDWTSCTPTSDETDLNSDPVAPDSRKRTRECSIPGNMCIKELLGAAEEIQQGFEIRNNFVLLIEG